MSHPSSAVDGSGADADPQATPMFPLGTVLFPGMPLPLRVFEPRYVELLRHVLALDPPEFGVALIERGSEVGGGDVRTSVATMARVLRVEPEGATFAVLAAGAARVRVTRWLADDPYPRALTTALVDDDEPSATPLDGCEQAVRRLLALHTELGASVVPSTIGLADDAADRAWQLCAIAPLAMFDRQRLLASPSWEERLGLLRSLADDAAAAATALLGADPADPGAARS